MINQNNLDLSLNTKIILLFDLKLSKSIIFLMYKARTSSPRQMNQCRIRCVRVQQSLTY